ncbi:MAG: DUF5335 family protein [Blastocatellia bacterium]
MSAAIERAAWSAYFREYSERNEARPTRLEIFGDLGAQLLEHDLPFSGITLEESRHAAPQLQIMLGYGPPPDQGRMTHTVTDVTRIRSKEAVDGTDEALEIEDVTGTRTLLSFTGEANFLPAT